MGKASETDVPPVTRMLARLTGARLCFGRPVSAGGRTVIPVASVRSAGGGGFGSGSSDDGAGGGGGGGGMVDARPVGFIEISSTGTRYERIDDGRMALRAIGAGTLALLVVGRTFRRRPRKLLGAAGTRALARRATAAERPRGGAARLLLRRARRSAHSSQRS